MEIKFRAWSLELNQMFFSFENDGYDESREFSPFIFDIGSKGGWACSDFEIMQFTGLKDKNGVDIYEGDIVRCFKGNTYVGMQGDIYEIKWNEDCLMWALFTVKSINSYRQGKFCTKSTTSQPYIIKNPTIEVIGNIYENPELL